MNYDIIIAGGGAAGMSAAIYSGRSGMKTLVLEKLSPGGQIMNTYEIDNYPGFPDNPSGAEIAALMERHAKKYPNVEFSSENVKEITDGGGFKTVKTRRNAYTAKAVIYAEGAVPKKLGISGEAELTGAGVSYCAVCDGAFFKGLDAAVIGGGNTAFEDALYLSRLCRRVYIINRSQRYRAAGILIEQAKNTPSIEFIPDTTAEEFCGSGRLESIRIKNAVTGEISVLNVSGAVIAAGVVPNSHAAVKCGVAADENGFIETDKNLSTNIKGIFAAGDVRTTPLRQVITAAADGAVAASAAINYIRQGGNI